MTACGAHGKKRALLALALLALGGCTDRIASAVTGLECNLIRIRQGGAYCQERVLPQPPPLFCYRTLASVDCYEQAEPFMDGAAIVGRTDHNRPVREPRTFPPFP